MLAGIYFIFSNTIMPSLKGIASGPEAMQFINRTIQNTGFFILFFGSFVSSNILIALSLVQDSSLSLLAIIASGLLISAFISTVLVNVPLNNLLDKQIANTAEMDQVWTHYLNKWLRWNHLRALLCLLSALIFLIECLFIEG
tara:strand:- start:1979 stop:2404 length:426 start_codon:yes stop_codon:yes gene_type:complete